MVDLGCETGASFPSLMAGIGESGRRFIGADASSGMLQKAKARSRRMEWENVELLQVDVDDDANGDSAADKRKRMRDEIGTIDRVLCFLSLRLV
ncbi:MAG: methyltransferase domain-containing protein [Deltaproteobacteria bacterium]|nr:methyltransferase domain-containing protein [Deltaproteobacteria bacterium]